LNKSTIKQKNMVNNNGIPIEVKKPVETVYEIKNEVPSYE
jgi:hypothetical protein